MDELNSDLDHNSVDFVELFNKLSEIECPYVRAIEIIGNKNTLLILKEFYIHAKPYRFNEILRALAPMSSKTLSEKLTMLERYRIISRDVMSTKPVIIRYSLTERGLDLKDLLDNLANWSNKWFSKESSVEISEV